MVREARACGYNLENTVTLKGNPSLNRSRVSLKAMMKVIEKDGGGIPMEFNRQKNTQSVEPPSYLQGMLDEFKAVFDSPTRNHEHAIILKVEIW